MNQDEEHLRLLSIFHYAVGGIAALSACIPFLHLFIGLALLFGAIGGHGGGAPIIGLLFSVMATCFILVGWCLAICLFIAAGYLKSRKHYTFCFVVAAVSCMFTPFGTVLGVFTIIVLSRPSVKEIFEANKEAAPAA